MGYIGQVPTAIPLTSADITDGTIALADMAANSIDSDQYVDGSIDTAHIATNQIDETLIKDAFVGDFSDVTVTAADAFLYGDATDSGNTKKDTIQGILDLAGGGKVTQVKSQTYDNQTAATSATSIVKATWGSAGGSPVSSSYFDINITPTSATHDFLIFGHTNVYKTNSTVGSGLSLQLYREITGGANTMIHKCATSMMYYSSDAAFYDHTSWVFLDRLAHTTSNVNYSMWWYNSGGAYGLQLGQGHANITVIEIDTSIVS